MSVKAVGLLAALALGGAGWAAQIRQVPPVAEDEGKVVVLKDLQGKVIGFDGDTLYVEANGAAVPLEVTPGVTAINREIVQGDVGRRLEQDFGKGQKVRARFGIQDLENRAVSIDTLRR